MDLEIALTIIDEILTEYEEQNKPSLYGRIEALELAYKVLCDKIDDINSIPLKIKTKDDILNMYYKFDEFCTLFKCNKCPLNDGVDIDCCIKFILKRGE